jgi:hypothetical protein
MRAWDPPLVHAGMKTFDDGGIGVSAPSLHAGVKIDPTLMHAKVRVFDDGGNEAGLRRPNALYACHAEGLALMGQLGWLPCASLSQRSNMRTYSRSCAIWESSRPMSGVKLGSDDTTSESGASRRN